MVLKDSFECIQLWWVEAFGDRPRKFTTKSWLPGVYGRVDDRVSGQTLTSSQGPRCGEEAAKREEAEGGNRNLMHVPFLRNTADILHRGQDRPDYGSIHVKGSARFRASSTLAQTLPQRRATKGNQAHETMLNLTASGRGRLKPLRWTPVKMTHTEKTGHAVCQ